jgi:ABC-2 type transport system permease protein
MTTNVAAEAGPAMPMGRLLRAYLAEAKYELLHMLRTQAFAIPFLAMPAPLYLFFGAIMGGSSPAASANPALADYIFSGWCAFAVIGPGMFGVGCGLAMERDAGLLKLKRALPAPAGAYLIAKLVMSMAFAAFGVGIVAIAAAIVGKITLSLGEMLSLITVMVVGALPFCAIGLFIGAHVSGAVAPAIANVVFLPMLWLSGLFFPLPEALRSWVIVWPAFHLNQIALSAAGVESFVFIAPQLAVAVLVAVTVMFGGLALRRIARVG